MDETAYSRREFLRRGAQLGATMALGGSAVLSGCNSFSMPALDPDELVAPALHEATVAAVRGHDLYAMTFAVLDRLGGIGTIVQPGESVFIKPNFLTAGLRRDHHAGTGEIAKPDIALAAAEACLRAGAREVTIGDGAQVREYDWETFEDLFRTTTMAAAAARLNAQHDGQVRLACLNVDSPEWDAAPSRRTNLGHVYISSLVTRADRVISIPVIKTHRHAKLSTSMKNFMGVTPISRYGGGNEYAGRSKLHYAVGGVEGAFLDVVDAVRPDLTIIDLSIGCEGWGPWVRPGEGRRVDLRERLGDWVLLASSDLAAADATAARMIGKDPGDVPHLRLAHRQGLGQIDAARITLVGAAPDELRVEWDVL